MTDGFGCNFFTETFCPGLSAGGRCCRFRCEPRNVSLSVAKILPKFSADRLLRAACAISCNW